MEKVQQVFQVQVPCPSNSPDLNLYDVLHKLVGSMQAPPCSMQQRLGAKYHSTPAVLSRACLNSLELLKYEGI